MAPAPLLLIHGFTAGPAVWDPVRPALEAEADVWTPTMQGHRGGAPIEPGRNFRLGSLADDLERQMDERGVERAFVAGNSLGGFVALELAARGRAEAVCCLAPAGGWAPRGAFEVQLVASFAVANLLARSLPAGFWTRPRVRREFLAAVVTRPERITAPQYAAMVEDLAACTAVFALLRRRSNYAFELSATVRCPVSIAWSENDQILPHGKARARFAELAPAAEQHELPGVGHVPMSDAPEAVAEAILDATTRLPRPPSASGASSR